MNSDERKSDDYWMGVRDALRMIDSFHRWSRQNPKRAKKLEDFIADGLIAAAKRCKTCLSRELGIGFKEDKDEREDSLDTKELSEPAGIPVFFEESPLDLTEPFESSELPDDVEAPPPPEPVADEDLPQPFDFIDSGPTEETSRDIRTDFELVEPEPLITKPEEPESEISTEFEVTGPPEIDIEDELPSISEYDTQDDTPEPSSFIEEIPTPEEPVSPTTAPRFSWDDQDDLSPTSSTPSDSESESSEPKESTSAKVRIWSPYDEPSISESDSSPDSDFPSTDIEDEVEESESETSPSTTEEPPAPPPPPESDESEEERKRKARRLFFGT